MQSHLWRDLARVAPSSFNLRRVQIKEAELSREEVKMKTLSLAAFVGCILAIGLAIQFDEYDGEQVNSDLRETEDLPFLRKAEG